MWSDRDTEQDCLGYRTYVRVLGNICTHKDLAPLTLGIFGPWGSGKTSLMRMLMGEVEATKGEKKRHTLWFNAWMYEKREEAQSALIHSILGELQKEVTLVGEVKQLVDKLKSGASVMKMGKFLLNSAVTLTPDIKGFLECFKDESEKIAATMASFEKDFRKLLELVGIDRVVVFIDDLDRCSSAKVIETFETIKLFLNTPTCTFVIGADAEKIQQAVAEVYQGTDLKRQKDYLEKIVQIPFSIPAQNLQDIGCYVGMLIVGRHLNDQAWARLADARPTFYKPDGTPGAAFATWVGENRIALGNGESEALDELNSVMPYVETLGRGLRGNPRQIKRFLNILSLRRQLADANKLEGVRPELLVKLAVLEYVWGEYFNTLTETVDSDAGTSELLQQISDVQRGEPPTEQSPTLLSFLSEPGLVDFIAAEPPLDGASNLSPYLFLAQTSLNRGQRAGIVSVDEKTKQLVRAIEGADPLLSRTAAKRAASQEPGVASAVARQLLNDLAAAKDPAAITNILGGLTHIGSANKDLFKPILKQIGDLDGRNHAIALSALSLIEKARQSGAEIPETLESKFQSASKIAEALSRPRSGKKGGGR